MKNFLFKGRAAERAYAIGQLVATAKTENTKEINISWEVKLVNGHEELVPVVNVKYYKKGGLLDD